MVIRHELKPQYSRAPSAMTSNGSAMHPSYQHHGHSHHQIMHQPHQYQHHNQRYYAPPSHQNPSPHPPHHGSSQSPSHHAAVALQSMHHHFYPYPSGQQRAHIPQPNAPPMAHPSLQPSHTTAAPMKNATENGTAEGFNMLIAAATSESVNSIDESEEQAKGTSKKGILKKHPRGKQLVSPLESEAAEKDVVEKRDDKEQSHGLKEKAPSAGPLKKRRKVDEDGIESNNSVSDENAISPDLWKNLHKALSEEPEALEWLPDGKSFRVLRWDVIVEKVLPGLLSKETTAEDLLIQTFRGYLKDYGFVETKHGKYYGSYCHEFFVKDEPDLISKITPKPNRMELSPTYDITQSGSSLDGGMEWRSTRRVAHSIFKLPSAEHGQEDHASREQPHPSYLHMPVLTTTATASFAENWGSKEDRSGANNHHPLSHYGRPNADAYFPCPYPPHTSPHRTESKDEASSGRSPKIIRFREDEEAARSHSRMHSHASTTLPMIEISPNDGTSYHPDSRGTNNSKSTLQYDMVQITPNPDYDQTRTASFKPHFPVSRRGGRGGGMMRPVVSSKYASI